MPNFKVISMAELFVIDTFAWIEYFIGSKRGEKVMEFIETKKSITPTIVIAELCAKYSKDGEKFDEKIKFVMHCTNLANLDYSIAESSGRIHTEQRKKIKDFGIVDSVVYATALKVNAKVVTGDPHFNNIKESIII